MKRNVIASFKSDNARVVLYEKGGMYFVSDDNHLHGRTYEYDERRESAERQFTASVKWSLKHFSTS